MASFQAKIGWKRLRKREIIKIIVPFLSYPTYNRKFQQNRKKFKKLKNTNMASLQAKICSKMQRRRENKNFRSISFQLEVQQKIIKKIQKIKKYHYGFFSS